jgi:hypothetical protein
VLVEPIRDRLSAGASLFASTVRSLARLAERYSDADLSVVVDFLRSNSERLREETRKLHASEPAPAPRRAASAKARAEALPKRSKPRKTR